MKFVKTVSTAADEFNCMHNSYLYIDTRNCMKKLKMKVVKTVSIAAVEFKCTRR